MTEDGCPRAGRRVTSGIIWSRTSVQIRFSTTNQSGTQTTNARFSADVPSPADKASVFVDAVPAERKATSVNRL